LAQGLGEHRRQRQHQEQQQEAERQRDQRGADPGRFGSDHALWREMAHAAPERLRCHTCRPLIASSSMKEIASITTATAVAPAKPYCSSLPMMIGGVISETMGMLPAMKITEPYSPTARAKAMAKPVSSAGAIDGKITRLKVCQRVAPSDMAA